VANFSASPASGEAPLDVNFADGSTGNITSWEWDFDDGRKSTQQNPSCTYDIPGTYAVRLTVTGPGGSDSHTRSITVTPPAPPIADFSANPTNGGTPLTVSFIDESIGNVTEWLWDFGDGVTSASVQQSPAHTYYEEGTYTVSLTVMGPGGEDALTRVGYVTVERLSMYIADIDLIKSYRGPKKWQATATVQIMDFHENPVSGASVYGTWSGAYSGNVSGYTDSNGTVSFSTIWVKSSSSVVTFAVNNVVKSGYEYISSAGNSVTASK
jgi:PKD repeat protein